MSSLRPEEDEARRFFEAVGLLVTPIPTESTRTPDLLVDGDVRGYLVEVKRRTDTEEFLRALRTFGDAEQVRLLDCEPRLLEIVADARRQMRELDASHARLWIVWLNLDLHAGGSVGIQTVAGTVYGVKQAIVPAEQGERAISVDCYYAQPGAFERWPELDAVIASVPAGFCMFANEFSPNLGDVLASPVARRLSDQGAVVVPREREAVGTCFLADREVDRRNEAAVVADLQRRYGKRVVCLAEPRHMHVIAHRPQR